MKMIEIQAKLLRGPVYFCEETIQCLITLRNVPPQLNSDSETSGSEATANKNNAGTSNNSKQQGERLCWANVQLHCFCLTDESQVNTAQIFEDNEDSVLVNGNSFRGKRSSIALETYASNDTSFHECLLRAEKGIIVYHSNPKILFCDLQLAPYECQTFIYTETLPSHLNPTYSSPRLKYQYKLTIGVQRIGAPINLLKMPIRILAIGLEDHVKHLNGDRSSHLRNGFESNHSYKEHSLNSSFSNDDESRDESTPLDLALHRIEYQTCTRNPHSFNITSSSGRVAKFTIFKTVYRLGEDIIGMFNFTDGNVPCVRYTCSLQSEETIVDSYKTGSKSTVPQVVNHGKCQEYTFNTAHSQMVITIPLTATPTFTNDIVSLEWKLHFRFIISQNIEQASPVIYSRSEDAIQQVAPRELNVQTMTWDFPIKVLATHPAHVAKGFQMASIGTLNI